MFKTAQQFVEESKRITDEDELCDAFLRNIEPCGFDKFAACSIVDFNNVPGDIVALNRYPDSWNARYAEEDYIFVDPTIQLTPTSVTPFVWSQTVPRVKLAGRQRQLMEEAAAAGVQHGITVPVHSKYFYSANVSVCGINGDVPVDALMAVHLMAIYLHESARRIVQKRTKGHETQAAPLSPREREVLRWAAVGKTDWEVGEILGISQNTAHFHVERAKSKLGVSTRVQAVVQALVTNQIDI